ncbi:hypothetical protein Vlu01_18420 [Micromonospora lutea]|uniref:Uncharacterized protein n=1 Tax=Micromonospora lutea TaxID=419825 RepID=A0ABQ4ITI6_9ACTN|nr:hypothetical protein Vlu01_18420 [Micromonospora lutea]
MHPDWCASDRCGHLVPPVMSHMQRRHRGASLKVGDPWASGSVVSYLVGADGQAPRVMVHVSCRVGTPWAELPLSQVRQLVEQLRSLLAQAEFRGDAHGDD